MQKSKGFGLIEIMIAIAVIAGAALVVSQFVTNQAKQQIQVRNSSDCEAAIAGVLAKIKQLDSNTAIDRWMPTDAEMAPAGETNYLQTRMTLQISSILQQATPGLITPGASPDMNAYLPAETTMASQINSYQLIYSATNMLSGYFNAPGSTYCTADTAILRDGSDYLSTIVTNAVDEETDITAKIEKINLSTGSVAANPCTAWNPVPVNASVNANSNSDLGFRLVLKATYQTTEGVAKTCQGGATYSAGSDLIAPTVGATITAQPGMATVAGGVLCGTGTSASFTVAINAGAGTAEAGVQYLCRLDYLRGRYTGPAPAVIDHTMSSGWFFCSAPTAALTAMSTRAGQPLTVSPVGSLPIANAATGEVNFAVGNASEGSYLLHVKAVDVARNESAVSTSPIILDLTRPSFSATPYAIPGGIANSINSHLNGNLFQCSNSHSDWTVNISEPITVSATRAVHHYHAGADLRSTVSCAPPPAGNVYEDMNAAHTSWNGDGPKTAEFIVCDECSAVLVGSPRVTDNELWFLETAANFAPTSANLDGNVIANSGGLNHNNPYVISALRLNSIRGNTGSINQAPDVATTYHTMNNYVNRVMTAAASPNFPVQTQIKACSAYGRYSYQLQDGCFNDSTNLPAARKLDVPSYQYTNTAGPGVCSPAIVGMLANTRYCPTFDISGIPAYNALGCAPTAPGANAAYTCDILRDGGYCGERPTNSCYFRNDRNMACRYPPCTGIDPRLGVPANTLEVGQSVEAITTPNPPCSLGCGQNTRTCVYNPATQTSSLSGSGNEPPSSCAPQTCPTCATHATHTQNCPSCNPNPPSPTPPAVSCIDIDTGSGMTCCQEPVATCSAARPVGPFTTAALCTAAPAINCTEESSGVWCGGTPGCIGSWSACSVPCGGGTQTYTLTSGTSCTPADGDTQACNTQACSAVIDCVGHWGDCSQPCGGGTQTYIVDTPAQNGGVACPFTAGQTQACNTSPAIWNVTTSSISEPTCAITGGPGPSNNSFFNPQTLHGTTCIFGEPNRIRSSCNHAPPGEEFLNTATCGCTSGPPPQPATGVWTYDSDDSMGQSDVVCGYPLCSDVSGQVCTLGAPPKRCVPSNPGGCCSDPDWICGGSYKVYRCQ